MKRSFNLIIFLLILLIFSFFSSSFAKSESLSNRSKITKEEVTFEVIVKAKCRKYKENVIDSIQISKYTGDGCLPISLIDGKMDVNDRIGRFSCVDLDNKKSIFRFHEMISKDGGDDYDEESNTSSYQSNYVVSWILSFPFIESTRKYSYLKRPSCKVKTDLCSSAQFIDYCNENTITLKNGKVTTKDRVYFIPPNLKVGTCMIESACCPYISTFRSGICGGKSENPCENIDCNDNNACTSDSCNPSNGKCNHTPNIDCDDKNACTSDSCDPSNGKCVNSETNCDDNNPDTMDSCDASNGKCVHLYNCSTLKCDPIDKCDVAVCNSTNGCSHSQLSCNDNIDCTDDTCDANEGCVFKANNDKCGDGNDCTNDICNVSTGCENTPIISTECPAPLFANPVDNTQCGDLSVVYSSKCDSSLFSDLTTGACYNGTFGFAPFFSIFKAGMILPEVKINSFSFVAVFATGLSSLDWSVTPSCLVSDDEPLCSSTGAVPTCKYLKAFDETFNLYSCTVKVYEPCDTSTIGGPFYLNIFNAVSLDQNYPDSGWDIISGPGCGCTKIGSNYFRNFGLSLKIN